MPISFGKSKEEDVVSLIAAKKYARAVEILKAQLQKKGANPSLRMQLADVLILADKKQEAVALLLPLADQYARDGFAAKAVSVLKKVQKVDPGRRDVEERLARQIEERQREAAVSLPRSVGMIGIEEVGSPGAGPGRRRRRSRSASSRWRPSPLRWRRRRRSSGLPCPRGWPRRPRRPSPRPRPRPAPTVPAPVPAPGVLARRDAAGRLAARRAVPAGRAPPPALVGRLPTRGSRTTTSCTPARRRTRRSTCRSTPSRSSRRLRPPSRCRRGSSRTS